MLFVLDVAAIFILGFAIGILVHRHIVRNSEVGTLRVDTSDPDDGPYLFLELNKGVGDISARRYVMLKVDLNGYLSQK